MGQNKSEPVRIRRLEARGECGEIPDYALWPDGRPCPTTVFYKSLRR